MGINTITISGRLGQDVELKTITTGQKVANFSLAVDDYAKGEKKTMWVNVVAWEKKAETCEKMLFKGCRIAVTGKLDISTYEKNGEKRNMTKITAHNIDIYDFKDNATIDNTVDKKNIDDVPF